MDRQEFLDRSRQEFSKRSDAWLAWAGCDFTRGEPRFGDVKPGRFFFSSEQIPGLLHLIRERNPEEAARIVERADKICEHRFDLLGYENLNYGEAIDWHLDLVHGKRSLRKAFHRVKYLDFAEVGDSKVTWELNRHQHLVILAKAYRFTGDERYTREIHAQWRDWHVANPYPIGINWASSLEVAFRSLSWIWVYRLLEGTVALDADFRLQWLKSQALNGRHIERYLSTYFSANTHLLGEGVVLFFLGVLCPELSAAERWRNLGWRIVLEQARRQVNADGLHFEQSTYYHVYALDLFLHTILLAEANGLSVAAELKQIIERMSEALFRLSVAGPPAPFGDDDGGRLFDPERNGNEHLLDPLATGAVLFKRGDFKQLVGELREETIWLLGERGVGEWDRLKEHTAAVKSVGHDAAGVYVLGAGESQLVIAGAPAVEQSYGHSHADALSVCLQSGGRSLLIDPGTGEYVGDGNTRNLFRGTAMHSTLRVDESDQAETDGPFSWKKPARAWAERWIVGKSFSLFVGSHDGYRRLAGAVVHRRCVVALKAGIFLVRDSIEGEGEHRLDIAWHLAPDLLVGQGNLFFSESGVGLGLLAVEDRGWAREVRETVWSPVYGRQVKARMVNFGAQVTLRENLPVEFATLIVPLQVPVRDNAAAGTFVRVETAGAMAFVRAYRYQNAGTEYRFFFARKRETWSCGVVKSDAEFLCLTLRAGAQSPDIVLCNGSYVEMEGSRVVDLKSMVEWYEVIQGEVFCPEP